MNLSYHYTHYNVREDVGRRAKRLVWRFGGSWNTYRDHPPGYGLDATSVDFWGPMGRGYPVGSDRGNRISLALREAHAIMPIRWLIWQGRIWYPGTGWQAYNAWQGSHHDHVHVTFL